MKKTISVLCIISSLTLLGVTTTKVAASTSDQNFSNSYDLSNEMTLTDNGRSDLSLRNNTSVSERLKRELGDLAFNLTYNLYDNNEIRWYELLPYYGNWSSLSPWLFSDIPFAKVNNDMVLKNGETLAAHSADLYNNTGIEQTMSTPSFTYTQTDSVSTSTTHATGVSLTASAEMNFPLVSASMSMTVGYDFSTTKAVESSVTKEWSVPYQHIKVPAGHKYKVNWILNTGVATGTTDLTSQVNAAVPTRINPTNGMRHGLYVGDAITNQNRLVSALPSTPYIWGATSNWERVSGNTALRKWGTSRYTAKFGTELIMTITDVTNARTSPVIVQQIPMELTPNVIG